MILAFYPKWPIGSNMQSFGDGFVSVKVSEKNFPSIGCEFDFGEPAKVEVFILNGGDQVMA